MWNLSGVSPVSQSVDQQKQLSKGQEWLTGMKKITFFFFFFAQKAEKAEDRTREQRELPKTPQNADSQNIRWGELFHSSEVMQFSNEKLRKSWNLQVLASQALLKGKARPILDPMMHCCHCFIDPVIIYIFPLSLLSVDLHFFLNLNFLLE